MGTMISSIPLRNEMLIAEIPKNSRNLRGAIKDWIGKGCGQYHVMSTMKNVAELAGFQIVLANCKAFIVGTSIPNVIRAVNATWDMCEKFSQNRSWSYCNMAEAVHTFTDLGAAIAYASAFFRRFPLPTLKVASPIGVANDLTDVVFQSLSIVDLSNKHKEINLLRNVPVATIQAVSRAVNKKYWNSWIKLLKAVTAVAVGIFVTYQFFMGVPLIPATYAVLVALGCSISNVGAYFHENYVSDYFLKVV
ncbi:MAG: hypothetical protein HW387_1321 [Parachlamydiales bacterium]|nr:hypothetical protein [Parachlamydiales bacterium]